MKCKLEHRNLSQIAVKRLLALADFLDSIPKRHWDKFDMDGYFHHAGYHDHKALKHGEGVPPKAMTICGTSACALGWAASMPAFQKAGLTMELEVQRELGGESGKKVTKLYASAARFLVDGVEFQEPDDAAAEFFDIPYGMAAEIFGRGPDGGVSNPKDWAKGVRYIVQTDGKGYF